MMSLASRKLPGGPFYDSRSRTTFIIVSQGSRLSSGTALVLIGVLWHSFVPPIEGSELLCGARRRRSAA